MSYPQQPTPQPGQPAYPPASYTGTSNPYANPAGHGMPPPVPYYPAPKRGMSIASLVLGIIALVFGISIIVQIVGLILGFVALGKEPEARGIAITGLVLNGITFIGWLIFIIIIVVAAAVSAGAAGALA